jgi:hypothetical protein
MRGSSLRAATLALAAAAVVAIHGCSEQLEGGSACPILCPDQDIQLRDTMVAAVALDTVLAGYPAIGDEPQLLLAARGDTFETRVIIRYDTLPTTYRPSDSPSDVPIEMVQEARLQLRLRFPAQNAEQTVTVEAYDIDTTLAEGAAADTAAATMLPLFRPDRFLGALTFKAADVAATTDSSIRIPIDDGVVLSKIQARERLRVGLLVRAAEPAELVFLRALDSLTFRVSADQAVAARRMGPYSATPADRFIADALADFVIVARRRPPDTPPEVITVGGVPGRRGYLRFDLPSRIIDSSSVVRATLVLTQYPNRLAARGADSISLYPHAVIASELVTELQKAATFIAPVTAFRVDSLRTAPDDSGDVSLEVVGLLQVWSLTEPERSSRALVLRLPSEGVGQDELYFYSMEAAEALRPRLRIVYVPRLGFGLP